VAQNQGRAGLGVVRDRLESGKHEHCGLAHSRDSLAEDVLTEDGDWDAALLNVGRMLKTAVGNGLEEFGLEEHILEGGAVDASVGSGLGSSGGATVLGSVFKVVLENVVLVVGQVSDLVSGGGFTVNHYCFLFVSMKLVSVRCVVSKNEWVKI